MVKLGAEHNALPFQRAVLGRSISISLTEIPMAACQLERAVQGVLSCYGHSYRPLEAIDARDLHPDQQRVVHSDVVPHSPQHSSTLMLKFLGLPGAFRASTHTKTSLAGALYLYCNHGPPPKPHVGSAGM